MTITPSDIEVREIVEIGLDRELESFSMKANWYEEYGMDSLGAVAVVVEVQKRYDIRIPDERMPDIQTGEQLKAVIEELSQSSNGENGGSQS